MSYTPQIFLEHAMTGAQKITALNTLETQYSEAVDYIDTFYHDSDYYTKTVMDSTLYRSPSHPSGRSDTGHGCGIDAATVDGYTKAEILLMALPPGCITFWTQSVATIPVSHGWHLLDDSPGRFLLAAGGAYTAGEIGGGIEPQAGVNFVTPGHALASSEIPNHVHTAEDYRPGWGYGNTQGGGWGYGATTAGSVETHTVDEISNAASSPHTHDAILQATGFLDDDGIFQTDADLLVPPWKAYCWVVRR